MEKGKLIGRGATAEVYEWEEDKIIKIYYKGMPKLMADYEYRIASIVQDCNIPAPKLMGKSEIEGRDAIIYEKINGVSMVIRMAIKPWTVKKEARRLAELHYGVHSNRVEKLPSQKEALRRSIGNAGGISDEKKELIIKILDKLPDGDVLCHGDLHPDNVLIGEKDAVIIDWMTGVKGCAAGDVARTMLILKSGELPSNEPVIKRLAINFLRKTFSSEYIKHYIGLSNLTMEQIEPWTIPIMAGRLVEGISEKEKSEFICIINKYLHKEFGIE